MKRIGIAAVAGGIVLFVWSFVSWMFIPWHMQQKLPDQAAVAEALRDSGAPDGFYRIPGLDYAEMKTLSEDEQNAAHDAWEEQHRKGPLAVVAYRAEGGSPMPVMTLIVSLVLEIIIAGAAAVALNMAAPAIDSFVGRVLFVLVLGVFAGGGYLMDWNWMYHPFRYSIEMFADGLVASLLLGVTLAIIVKPDGAAGGMDDMSDFEVSAGP